MRDLVRCAVMWTINESGCWIWNGTRDEQGYGRFCVNKGHRIFAHRLTFRLFKGPIHPSLTIDHLCRTTSCVNPEHLELVTIKENIRRGNCPSAIYGRRTHCWAGHEFTKENTYLRPDGGGRSCLTCRRASALKCYYNRKRTESCAT